MELEVGRDKRANEYNREQFNNKINEISREVEVKKNS